MDRVRQFWEQTPCGTRDLGEKEGTPEFFDRLEKDRDGREPFIQDFARFSRWTGKKVLEVGIGAGTDFIRFARAGADLFGVDLTRHAVDLVGRRLALEGLSAHIRQCDAEHLPFEDDSFDLVYSWGVIHHTGNTRQAADEIVRVARCGGRICVMIYHRHSLVAAQCWLLHALLKGRPWRTFSDVIRCHIESDGTKAYSIREAKELFGGLADLIVTPVVTPYDVRLTRSTFLPRPVQSLIPKRFGWFLVVQGTKRA
jgi:SAM-dependent methyltransferase